MNKNNKLTNFVIVIGIIFLIASLILTLTKTKLVDNHIIDIDYIKYHEIIKEDKNSIILLTSPTCIHCKDYKPNVNYVADDYQLVIYNLNVSELSFNEYTEIHDKYTSLKNRYNDEGYPSILTPTTIIVRNGEEVDSILGDAGYNGFLNFLKKNDIIK